MIDASGWEWWQWNQCQCSVEQVRPFLSTQSVFVGLQSTSCDAWKNLAGLRPRREQEANVYSIYLAEMEACTSTMDGARVDDVDGGHRKRPSGYTVMCAVTARLTQKAGAFRQPDLLWESIVVSGPKPASHDPIHHYPSILVECVPHLPARVSSHRTRASRRKGEDPKVAPSPRIHPVTDSSPRLLRTHHHSTHKTKQNARSLRRRRRIRHRHRSRYKSVASRMGRRGYAACR